MLDDVFIMGLSAWITELLKQRGLPKTWLPLPILGLTAALNVLNAALFDPATGWRDALKTGLVLGAATSGIYGLGQAVKSGEKKEDFSL